MVLLCCLGGYVKFTRMCSTRIRRSAPVRKLQSTCAWLECANYI